MTDESGNAGFWIVLASVVFVLACRLLLSCCSKWFVLEVYHPTSNAFAKLDECMESKLSTCGIRILTLNLWSGSTYEFRKCDTEKGEGSLLTRLLEQATGTGGALEFYPGEDMGQREKRFQAVVAGIKRARPGVIALNEVLPCPELARRLADELGYDCLVHVGVAGIRLGHVLEFPAINEGDALLAHPDLCLEYAGRTALTGQVFYPWLSLNTGDATQALAGTVRVPSSLQMQNENDERFIKVAVVVTHWHAGLLEDRPTLADIDALSLENIDETALAKAEISKGSAGRTQEALKTLKLLDEIESRQPDVTAAIICGDLNTTRDTPEFAVFQRAGFTHDQLDSPTWDPVNNPNVQLQIEAGVEGQSLRPRVINELYSSFSKRATKLDHVLVRSSRLSKAAVAAAIANAHEVCQESHDGVVASDHYGVCCDVRLDRIVRR